MRPKENTRVSVRKAIFVHAKWDFSFSEKKKKKKKPRGINWLLWQHQSQCALTDHIKLFPGKFLKKWSSFMVFAQILKKKCCSIS